MSNLMMTVTFELNGSEKIPMFAGVDRDHILHESFHEALCKAIHEEDPSAIRYLRNWIQDIKVDQIVEV